MELKTYTPVGSISLFEKIKLTVLHYIQHDFICPCPGLSKDQTSMFKSFVINQLVNGYIKGDKYSFFIKVGEAKVLLILNYLQSRVRVDTIQKDHFYHTKQYQIFYRKIKYDLSNFKGVQNG